MIILHNINHNFSIFKDTSQDLILRRIFEGDNLYRS